MLEYIEKFNNLPADVKTKISSGDVMVVIGELEQKFGVDLATFVIKVMVGELYYKNITANLIIEYNLDPDVAATLATEMENRIFSLVKDFLSGAKSAHNVVIPEVTNPFFGKRAEENKATSTLPSGVKPGPIVRQVPAASKNIFDDDAKEIASMSRVVSPASAPVVAGSLLVDAVVKEANISFASENLVKRFKELISSYLRGIRTRVEVRENLLKDVAFGGLKMEEKDADRILDIAQKKKDSIHGPATVGAAKVNARTTSEGTSFTFKKDEIMSAIAARKGETLPTNSPVRDVDYDLSALSKRGPVANTNVGPVATESKNESLEKVSMTGEPLVVKAPVIPVVSAPALNIPEKIADDAEVKRTSAPIGNKKRMEDIKVAPKLMSPIDELAYMDLVNFRRLDVSPAKRIAKIEEKINLLEKEGIDKKIAGIKAWRNNPVSKTYLSMGRESIGGDKSVDDIIKERQDQGLNYLSKEEFEAVMDLNDKLRF